MIFIINDNVRYNEVDGILESVKDTGNSLSLLKPTARLLSVFVRNNNLLITREQLLNDVWEDYGLKASNNNLNNYISALRKSLHQFGEEELLITYPRQGFKFMANVIRREDSAPLQEEEDNSKPLQQHLIATSKKKGALIRGAPWPCMAWSLIILLALITAGMLYKSQTKISLASVGQYKRCQIYSVKNDGVDAEEIKAMIYYAGYTCDEKSNVYYYGEMRTKGTVQASSPLLAYCPLDNLKPCENTYLNSHSKQNSVHKN